MKNEVIDVLNIRLNMTDLKGNYKHSKIIDQNCRLCKEEKHTTVHVIECKVLKELTNHELTISQLKDSSIENVKSLRMLFDKEFHLRKNREDI